MTRAIKPAMLTVAEVAGYMGLSERSVWALIASGELGSVKIPSARGRGGRDMRRILQTDLDAFIAAHYQPATT